MDKARVIEAQSLLNNLLQWQPNLFTGIRPSAATGEDIADFCDAFIRKYSELRETAGPSRP